jgi:hypothetical protein
MRIKENAKELNNKDGNLLTKEEGVGKVISGLKGSERTCSDEGDRATRFSCSRALAGASCAPSALSPRPSLCESQKGEEKVS